MTSPLPLLITIEDVETCRPTPAGTSWKNRAFSIARLSRRFHVNCNSIVLEARDASSLLSVRLLFKFPGANLAEDRSASWGSKLANVGGAPGTFSSLTKL